MKYIHDLTRLGFNNKEAQIYKTLLELGEGSPPIISNRTKISKSTVNEIIKSLLRKGFVAVFLKKKRKWYVPVDPEMLRSVLDSQSDALNRVLPDLKVLYSAQAKIPTVTFFEGASGLETSLNTILEEASEVLSFSPDNKNFQIGSYLKTFDRKRIKKKIPFKSIFENSDYARKRTITDAQYIRRTKIIDNKLPFGAQLFLWANKTAFISFTDDFRVIVVEDIATTKTLKSLFEHIWET